MRGVRAALNNLVDAASVVASCVRADSMRGDENLEGILFLALRNLLDRGQFEAVDCARQGAHDRFDASLGGDRRFSRRAHSSQHRGERRAAGKHGRDVVDRQVGHRGAGFGRGAGEVRDEHDVLERQQAGMDGGLVLVDIERRAGNQPLLERPDERRFVDHRAARGVDEIRRPLHARKRLPVDEMPGLGRQVHVERDDVRRIQQAIERHAFERRRPPS